MSESLSHAAFSQASLMSLLFLKLRYYLIVDHVWKMIVDQCSTGTNVLIEDLMEIIIMMCNSFQCIIIAFAYGIKVIHEEFRNYKVRAEMPFF